MLHRFIVYINGIVTRMLRRDANYEKNYIAGKYGAVAGVELIENVKEIKTEWSFLVKPEKIFSKDPEYEAFAFIL